MTETEGYKGIGKKMLAGLRELRNTSGGEKIFELCGPITTGGVGSIQGNNDKMVRVVEKIRTMGHKVFAHTDYTKEILAIKSELQKHNRFYYYDWDLLYDCFDPLFASGLLDGLIFLEDFESSTGARWEYDMALKYGIPIYHWDDEKQNFFPKKS